MKKQEFQKLIKVEERIKQIVDDMGLKVYDIEFDICKPQKMLEIMAYRIPTNISSWKYGRDYERLRTIYEKYSSNLPYEVVINSNPSRAFLMNNNTFAVHCLVIAHVYGHVNVFAENEYFKNGRQDIMGVMAQANKRFNEYERKYGIDEIEYIVDAGHAIQLHSSPFDTETEDEKRARIYRNVEEKIVSSHQTKSEFSDLLPNDIQNFNHDLELVLQKIKRNLTMKTPVEPTSDILRYIIDNSRILEDWQKDILEMLRMEGQYFWPMMKTHYMNEGWACIVGDSLVHTENGFVPIIKAEEYCKKVVGINNTLTDIEERYYTKITKTTKIKTNIGMELEGADMHRILTPKGDVFLKDLKVGDDVNVSIGLDIWPDKEIEMDIDHSLKRQNFSRSQYVTLPKTINNDVAYLMGSLIAEGHMSGRRIIFTNQNDEYLKEIKDIWYKHFSKSLNISCRKDSDTKDIEMYSTTIIDYMEQAGMGQLKSEFKLIPWSILQSPKHIVSSFIAGYFDGDGCVYHDGKSSKQIIFTSKSEKLIRQLTIVLLNYGIMGYFAINKKKGYDDCYQLRISRGEYLKIFSNEIPFRDIHKQKLLKDCIDSIQYCQKGKNTCKITSISKGRAENYDWHIPDGNHYVAQGFMNHNTFIHQKVMDKLFREDILSISDHAQYNYSNSLVKAENPEAMNPYLIGSRMWQDIEERWDKGQHGKDWDLCTNEKEKENWDTKDMKGWEKCKQTMRTYTDWAFFQNFLTPKLIDELNMYIYQKQEKQTTIDYVVVKKKAEEIRQMIINSFAHSSIPLIEVVDGNVNGNGSMLLEHRWDQMDLDGRYAKETCKHICKLWGNKVHLRTREGKSEIQFVVESKNIPIR